MDRKVTELLVISKQVKNQEAKLDENEKLILDNLKAYENKLKDLQSIIQSLDSEKQNVQMDLNKAN